jgi:ABC-2 type transport system ATP-binding protein
MTVEDMIRFTAAFYPRWRADLADRHRRAFGLPPDRKVKALSRGMRTKLALLVALCRSADLLLLDEPTAGLDPAMIDGVLQILVGHVAQEATTIFFSSHQIAEVEQIADHVAILDRGRVAVAGALDALRESHRRIDLVFDRDAPKTAFRTPGVVRVQRQGRMLSVLSSTGAEPLLEEVRALGPSSVTVTPVTLRDIFLDTVHAEA